ncbi:hypothetical protein, partial [Streptomonospora sediminis]
MNLSSGGGVTIVCGTGLGCREGPAWEEAPDCDRPPFERFLEGWSRLRNHVAVERGLELLIGWFWSPGASAALFPGLVVDCWVEACWGAWGCAAAGRLLSGTSGMAPVVAGSGFAAVLLPARFPVAEALVAVAPLLAVVVRLVPLGAVPPPVVPLVVDCPAPAVLMGMLAVR